MEGCLAVSCEGGDFYKQPVERTEGGQATVDKLNAITNAFGIARGMKSTVLLAVTEFQRLDYFSVCIRELRDSNYLPPVLTMWAGTFASSSLGCGVSKPIGLW